MMKTLRQLLLVSRPISWPNTAFPFAATYLFVAQTVDWRILVGTVFFLIPYNLLMYGVNDVYDYESDLRNPRKGSIEGAKSDKSFHKTILLSAYSSALLLMLVLLALSDLMSGLILMAVMFFVLAYSIPLLRFKERPVLDSITSSLHFVGPMMYALSLVGFPLSAWPFILAFFAWGMGSHAFGAVQDINADRAGGIASIATVFGAKWTVRFSFVLYVLCSLILTYAGGPALIVGLVSVVYAVNIRNYLSLSDQDAERSNLAWRRFIYLNLFSGFIVTLVLISQSL